MDNKICMIALILFASTISIANSCSWTEVRDNNRCPYHHRDGTPDDNICIGNEKGKDGTSCCLVTNFDNPSAPTCSGGYHPRTYESGSAWFVTWTSYACCVFNAWFLIIPLLFTIVGILICWAYGCCCFQNCKMGQNNNNGVVVRQQQYPQNGMQMSPMHQQQQAQTMNITLPHGVVPGQQLQVSLNNGSTVTITVPNGAVGGQILTVTRPPPIHNNNVQVMAPIQAIAVPEPQPQSIQIKLPHGVMAGQQIQIPLQNGNMCNVTVPNGTKGGDVITIKNV